ncbi:MAG: hypothetical protein Q8L86_16335 [Vicinamibacterales bacterium]|nr:hypothetical protein [Vicinamibacterales bacterium]
MRRAARVGIVLVAAGLGVLAVEIALRTVVARLPVPVLIFVHRDIKDAHPGIYGRLREAGPNLQRRVAAADVGWRFEPNARFTGVNEDGEPYDHVVTAEGFLTPDEPGPGDPQLVTLGDSFMSTFVVPRPAAWVVRERVGLPVYNLAVGGWGPETYRAAYRSFAGARAHRRVGVFSFVNDISDVANRRAWEANDQGLGFLEWIQRENPDGEFINTGGGWLDRRSVAWNLAKYAFGASSRVAPDAPRVEHFPDGRAGTFPLQLIGGHVFAVNPPAAFEPGGAYYPHLQDYFESLERLRLEIESRGAEMALIWIPSKERVYLPLLAPERRAAYVTNGTGEVGGLEPVLARYARQAGIAFLDLTPAFTAAARAGERLYFTVDGHLNSRGNALLGELAGDFLANPPAATPDAPDTEDLLPFRSGPVAVAEPVDPADASARASLVRTGPRGWSMTGTADARFGYVLQWPERAIHAPAFVLARGQVRAGGLTIGVLSGDRWASAVTVTTPGRFDVALPVMTPGRYVLTVAHALPESSLETDVEVDEMGWAPVSQGRREP